MARYGMPVRKGTPSATKVQKNPGMKKVANMRLPEAAKPIRPRGAAASLKPRVAREATANTRGGTGSNAIRRRLKAGLSSKPKPKGSATGRLKSKRV